ncbi:sensor histidine kinase [Hymenobacter cellulosilyticus]|uniref:Histidine kinase n=1 Tax=Hymenobacter cellulosilyticus TaxID=2932248 RepID=A0A8T9QCS8_9BACT|nr:histidine kinase [Hymenobacter cellulosilyticus]UOQ73918.1 histidine kinase [Hymenobacter cellulosilyticus]
MAAFPIRRYLTPLIHVLMWGLFGLSLVLLNPLLGRFELPWQFWAKQALVFALWVAAFYLTAYVSVPRLLFRGHVGWFVLVILLTAAVVMGLSQLAESALNLQTLMDQHLRPPNGGFRPGPGRGPGPGAFRPRPRRFDMVGMLTTLLVLGISTSIAAVQKWQTDTQRRQELEQQKVHSELSFLKAQINPHFFFNTLNNIYALTVVDAAAARQAIHTLSRMMRYVLYETPADTTSLAKELAFVQDYVALMKLRLTERVRVELEWPEPVRDVPVAPMLLLPYVENAFKHGVSATQPSRIRVAVRQPSANVLELEVRNTRFAAPATSLDEGSGIGLANTQRRLDLLYPGRYVLQVEEATPEGEFCVTLTLHTV